MSEGEQKTHPFVDYLLSLSEGEKRGALASLRRGLGKPPGQAPEMFRYVLPWLPENASREQEQAYFLVASLLAYHPKNCAEGNMGSHLARCRDPQGNDDALERRFSALLAAHPEDLPYYLRQAVSFLKSKEEIPINWSQLLKDLLGWDHPDRYVQRQWARAFWSGRQAGEAGAAQAKIDVNP